MTDPDTIAEFAAYGALNELYMEAAPWSDNRWATAFKSRAGEYLVEIGRATHEHQGPPTWVYKIRDDDDDRQTDKK